MDHREGPRPRPRGEVEAGKREVDTRRPWLRLFDAVEEPACGQAIIDRVEELLWILDHEDDIDADFLAIYGIDLEQDDALTARRYFTRAQRLTAYDGVLAARIEEERDNQPDRTPTRTQAAPTETAAPSETTEVSLTQFRMQFPGLVSVAQGG